VAAAARRRCPRWARPEVEADALSELWLHVRAGKPVKSVPGLAEGLVRRVWAHRCRQQRWLQFTDEAVDAAIARHSRSSAATDSEHDPKVLRLLLRGTRQRWLAERVLAGASCAQIADQLGWPVGEVSRQLRRLAERLTAHGVRLRAGPGENPERTFHHGGS
jgi:DNA-directed RNA polymerase specialized sigma24 family protein